MKICGVVALFDADERLVLGTDSRLDDAEVLLDIVDRRDEQDVRIAGVDGDDIEGDGVCWCRFDRV